MTRINDLPAIAFAIATALVGCSALPALSSQYNFTSIYSGQNTQISGGGINDPGTVAFERTLGGVTGIYTGNGGALTRVVDSTQTVTLFVGGSDFLGTNGVYNTMPYSYISSPSIDNAGKVYFGAALYQTTQPAGIGSSPLLGYNVFAGNGVPISQVYGYGFDGGPLEDYPPAIPWQFSSNAGVVTTTFRPYTTLIQNGDIKSLPVTTSGGDYAPNQVEVNNAGTVVGYNSGGTALVVNQGGVWSLVLSTYAFNQSSGFTKIETLGSDSNQATDLVPAINNAGTIIYHESFYNDYQWTADELLMIKNGVTSVVVDNQLGLQDFGQSSINDLGSIVFPATFGTTQGISQALIQTLTR